MVSTALNNVWTVNYAGCPNGTIMGCEENRGQPFYYNESLTWIPNSIWALGFEKNLGLDTTANFGFDSVTLGWQGSGLPTVQRVVIASVSIETWWLGNFGLNPTPTNFSTFNDPQKSFMTQLKENNTIPSLSWAYTAGNQYRRFQPVLQGCAVGLRLTFNACRIRRRPVWKPCLGWIRPVQVRANCHDNPIR